MEADLDKFVIVGHRGAGKTSLLQRWRIYCPELAFADLDQEIEKAEGALISDIFLNQGEAYFRELERKVWHQLGPFHVVSVGGGFDLDLISPEHKILWVRRDQDRFDRIFLDRPPLPEYKKRFQERELNFQKRAHSIYTLPEGLFKTDEEEKKILLNQFDNVGGTVTLPLQVYPGTLIEVRDDLQMKNYATDQLLYSVRQGLTYPENVKIDWDVRQPLPEGLDPYILSTHENSLKDLQLYENTNAILKFCPLIHSWSELLEGLKWQMKNPDQYVFLPRSVDGRWNWFRLWMKGRQALNFWREGSGSSLDQPTLWQWLSHPLSPQQFAAVLGNPVQHSFSPVYHKSFFLNQGLPFYRIQIEESEWMEAIQILDKLGMVAAAVTSPLKVEAGKWLGQKPLNTLWKTKSTWSGDNTDRLGAESLLADYKKRIVVVWGGGGVLQILKEVLPEASFYSSRAGKPRENFQMMKDPEVLVWADPHDSIDQIPRHWKPKLIIDISYHDQSVAKKYAQKIAAEYVSGLKMFVRQAEEQQKFWRELGKI